MGVELSPGVTLAAVCAHVRTLRPFKHGDEFKDEDDWIDQITMVYFIRRAGSTKLPKQTLSQLAYLTQQQA